MTSETFIESVLAGIVGGIISTLFVKYNFLGKFEPGIYNLIWNMAVISIASFIFVLCAIIVAHLWPRKT